MHCSLSTGTPLWELQVGHPKAVDCNMDPLVKLVSLYSLKMYIAVVVDYVN